MKVIALSDLHGHLPTIEPCDLVLIPGDICPHGKPTPQLDWLDTKFRRWLDTIDAPVVACAGNHDWPMEKMPVSVKSLGLRLVYLQDSMAEVNGLRIYGSPWQRRFFDWAFNLDEQELNTAFDTIPPCDILLTHSPPYGIGDLTPRGEHVGSYRLLTKVEEIKPTLHVWGHIHCARGRWNLDGGI